MTIDKLAVDPSGVQSVGADGGRRRGDILAIAPLGNPAASPRAERAQFVAAALRDQWEVDLRSSIPAADHATGGAEHFRLRRARRIARLTAESVFLDKHEVRTRRAQRSLVGGDPPSGALLIGAPFSPLALAARKLAAHGVPFVVDVGDPWVLTARGLPHRRVGTLRARKAEWRMWRDASGAITTTSRQARALSEHFPQLPILVRPNGYDARATTPDPVRHPSHQGSLRLVHFGSLYESRLDPTPFFETLVESKRWERISLAQYGPDWKGALGRLPPSIEITHHTPIPWSEALAVAGEYDLALVIGNRNPDQLPSKTIQYLALSIPRVSILGAEGDALAEYTAGKPAYLAVEVQDPALAEAVAGHANRWWHPSELDPPREEAWPQVADRITEFLEQCWISEARRGPAVSAPRRPPSGSVEGRVV